MQKYTQDSVKEKWRKKKVKWLFLNKSTRHDNKGDIVVATVQVRTNGKCWGKCDERMRRKIYMKVGVFFTQHSLPSDTENWMKIYTSQLKRFQLSKCIGMSMRTKRKLIGNIYFSLFRSNFNAKKSGRMWSFIHDINKLNVMMEKKNLFHSIITISWH